MASGTQGATSTYTEGRGISFAKDIASRVVDAAVAAKEEKKHQQDIIAKGGEVPEKDRKGLFVKALKQEFISNPINDLKKRFNKKISGASKVVGLFGGRGEKSASKLTGMKFKIKEGFDRSGYKPKDKPSSDNGSPTGGSGSPMIAALGEIVLDIQQISAAITSMQGLIATQMNMSLKMSDSLEQIKSSLTEQVSLQQDKLNDEEMAAREASLESSQQTSGSSKATSTFNDPSLGGIDLIGMFGQLQNLFGIIKSLPGMFTGMLKGLLSKIPGGKWLMGKFGKKAAGAAAGEAAEAGAKGLAKGLLGKILRPIFKRIPIIGGLIDFAVSLALGEPVGRAAAKAAGATLGGALGAFVGSILPGPGTVVGGLLGGFAGDWVGGSLYDAIAGAFGGDKENKMASGGVMIGEAGPEMVTGLHSASGKKMMGAGNKNKGIEDVQGTYYSALAGSTLAITKDFVEGLGPIGAAITPIIQDDISKLGRQFDIPATATKVSVGGLGLRQDPQASKKGENYLKELVKGTLEKLTGGKKKDDKKKSSTSDTSGTSGDSSSNPTSSNTPTGGGKSDLTFGDSIASGLVGRQGANQQTVMDASGVSKVGASPADVLGQLHSFDKTKLKDKVVRLSSGITNNPSDLKSVEEQIKYLVSVGAKVQLVGVTNTPPTTGNYKHLEKSLAGMNDKLSALAAKYSDRGVSFLGGFTPGSDGIHPSNASELNTKFNVDVLPGGQVGAASGISIDTSGGGRRKLGQNTTFAQLNPHHGSGDEKRRYGYTKDYVMYSSNDPNNYNVDVPTPIDAKVEFAGTQPGGGGYGKMVELVDRTNKPLGLFGHFNKLKVSTGQEVKAGQSLGVQGWTGSVRPPGPGGQHLHLDASPQFHEKFVNFITSGKAISITDNSNDTDSPEDDTDAEEVNPFTAIEKAFTGMIVGAALSQGNYSNKEEFDRAKTEFENQFKAPPSPNQLSTSGDNAAATPNKPSTTPTATKPPSAIPPAAPSPPSPSRAAKPPSIPTVIPSSSPTMGSESLYRQPLAPYASGGMYRPLSYAS